MTAARAARGITVFAADLAGAIRRASLPKPNVFPIAMDVTDGEGIAAAIGRVEGCADAADHDCLVCAAGVFTGGAVLAHDRKYLWERPAKRRWSGPPAGHRAGHDQYVRLGKNSSAAMIRTVRPSPAYPWFLTSFVPGNSQDGRASLNFPLPRNHTTTL